MLLTSSKSRNFHNFNAIADYALEKVNSINLEKIKPFFNNLPPDPYLKEKFRFRRLSHFQVVDNRVIKLPHSNLFQTKDYNPLLGNVVRDYLELDDQLVELEDFQKIILEFFAFCELGSLSNEIGIHQIRTTASFNHIGKPAPEGIHRDGVDLVGIFSINRERIQGAETHLYPSKTASPVFTKILNVGEFLVFNDNQLFHYTSPMQATSNEGGIRDVFVLTCPGLIS